MLGVAQDLHAIIDMHERLPIQAKHSAASRLMPGGLAMVCLGPVASIEAAHHVATSIEVGRLSRYLAELEDSNDPWIPPLQLLLVWSEALRGEPNPHATEVTEARYLLDNLAMLYATEPHFEDFARDVQIARRRLEDVLVEGDREERSWVPCLDCDQTRDGRRLVVRLVVTYGDTNSGDGWTCPRCHRFYTPTEHNLAAHEWLRRKAEAELEEAADQGAA